MSKSSKSFFSFPFEPVKFGLPYTAPLFQEVAFTTWKTVLPSFKATSVKDSVEIKFTSDMPQNTRFVLRDLVMYWGARPLLPPLSKLHSVASSRSDKSKGHVYENEYEARETIGLTLHSVTFPEEGVITANNEWLATGSRLLFDVRKTAWPVMPPRSEISVTDRMKSALVIKDLTPTPGCDPNKGVELQIIGWGDTIKKAYMKPTSSATAKYSERCARVEWGTKPYTSDDDKPLTQFFLVVPDKSHEGKFTVIDAVPLREDGSLFGPSPIVKLRSGAPAMRLVGPGDMTRSSRFEVVAALESVITGAGSSDVRNKLVAHEVYFLRAPDTYIPTAPKRYASLDRTNLADYEEAIRALEELAKEEEQAKIEIYGAEAVAAAGSVSHPAIEELDDPDEEEDASKKTKKPASFSAVSVAETDIPK